MTKAMIVENYRYYRSRPQATARAVLYRMLLESLSESERKVFDILVDFKWDYAPTADQIAARIPELTRGQVKQLLRQLCRYGVVLREKEEGPGFPAQNVYRLIDFLDPEPIGE